MILYEPIEFVMDDLHVLKVLICISVNGPKKNPMILTNTQNSLGFE